MKFGQKLKAIRKRDDVTQRSLAEYLGMDTAYLSRIENDAPNHTPSVKVIERIIKGFDLTQADADSLFVLAGKLPPDVNAKLLANPQLFEKVRKAQWKNTKNK